MSTQTDLPDDEMEKARESLAKRDCNFWKSRVKSAQKLPIYEEQKKTKEEAIQYYKGNFFTADQKAAWEGDEVQMNLFKRTVNFMADSVYSDDPKIKCIARRKIKGSTGGMSPINDPVLAAESVEIHLNYVYDECDQRNEVRRTWKDSFFGNLAAAEIDFDKPRGLFRAKWIAGQLVCDPDAHGDLSRAKWLAKRVDMPRYRVWQDETFDPKARAEIQKRISNAEDATYTEKKDNEILWYVYTKEGVDPIKGGDATPNRLLIFCESYEGWLANIPNPTPWLDDDEYPISILRIDELPGEFIGPAMWTLIKGPILAFNWAASYHASDMRKTASRPIGFDKNKIDDEKLLKSRKHMVPIPVDGPVTDDVIRPLNIGAADKTIFDSVAFWHNIIDQVSGIDKIARGEQGNTKTATESQILQQNSNIVLRGPARALDDFMNDLIRKIALASLYYIPAFGTFVNPNYDPNLQPQFDPMSGLSLPVDPMVSSQFLTKMIVQQPQMDQMTGMPAMNPQTMMPAMQPTVQVIPAPEAPAAVKGIDFFHGDEIAMNWPKQPFEEIKSDLSFKIEAGSTRTELRLEKKQTALELFNTLGPLYQAMGLSEQYYNMIEYLVENFEVEDRSKFLPPKEIMMQAMMIQQQMAMQQGTLPDSKSKGDPNSFKQNKNEGKKFPMTGKEGSSGS